MWRIQKVQYALSRTAAFSRYPSARQRCFSHARTPLINNDGATKNPAAAAAAVPIQGEANAGSPVTSKKKNFFASSKLSLPPLPPPPPSSSPVPASSASESGLAEEEIHHQRVATKLLSQQPFFTTHTYPVRTHRSLLSPLSLLSRMGYIRSITPATPSATPGRQGTNNSRPVVAILPNGQRVLSKIEQLYLNTLKSEFDFQSLSIEGSGGLTSSSTASSSSYPTALAAPLASFTQLVAEEMRQRNSPLQSTAIHTRLHHPAEASFNTPLWSGPKPTDDFLLFDNSHNAALERYHTLVDSTARGLRHAGMRAYVTETDAHLSGIAQIDADLAHEIHVECTATAGTSSSAATASGTILKCNVCEYAAKPARAVSISPAYETDTSASHSMPADLQAALESYVENYVLGKTFSQHTKEQILSNRAKWKIEVLFQNSAASEEVQPLVFIVLLRKDQSLNVAAVTEHVSAGTVGLRHATTSREIKQVLSALCQNTEDESLIKQVQDIELTRAAAATSNSLLIPKSFDARPEILIDNSLLPEGLDLDLEEIQSHSESDEGNQSFLDELDDNAQDPSAQEEVGEQGDPSSDPAADENDADLEYKVNDEVSDPSYVTSMEKSFMAQARKLRPGEGIDLVQLDLAARGLNIQEEKSKLLVEATRVQKEEYERKLEEKQEEQQNRELQKKVDENEQSPDYNPLAVAEAQKELANEDNSTVSELKTSPTPPVAAALQALIPHFEYSRQGFFHLANPGDACAFCASNASSSLSFDGKSNEKATRSTPQGNLQSVRTNVVANSVFIGKQELVRDAEEIAAEEAKLRALVEQIERENAKRASKSPFLMGKKKKQQMEMQHRTAEEKARKMLAAEHATSGSKRKFLHTSYLRISPFDLLTHTAVNNSIVQKVLTEAAAAAASSRQIADPKQPQTQEQIISQLPPMVAPFQIAIIPITHEVQPNQKPPVNPRDIFRNRGKQPESTSDELSPEEKKRRERLVLDECEKLQAQIQQLSVIESRMTIDAEAAEPSSASKSAQQQPSAKITVPAFDFRAPTLEGEVLLDDQFQASAPQRVNRYLASGVPIVLMVSYSSLQKGTVRLILNKKNVPIAPRSVARDGLHRLVVRMTQTNYGSLIQEAREKLRSQLQQQGAAASQEEEEDLLAHERQDEEERGL